MVSLDAPVVGLDSPVVSLDAPVVSLDSPVVGLDSPVVGLDWFKLIYVVLVLPFDQNEVCVLNLLKIPHIVLFDSV